jgi:hypothetical protein
MDMNTNMLSRRPRSYILYTALIGQTTQDTEKTRNNEIKQHRAFNAITDMGIIKSHIMYATTMR